MKLEKIIIGSCLTFEKCLDAAIEKLDKKHFQYYAPVFGAIQKFYRKGRDHEDIVFDVNEMLGERSNSYNFHEFVNQGTPSINEQIEQLETDWKRRMIIQIADRVCDRSKGNIEDAVMDAIHELSALIAGNNSSEQSMQQVMQETLSLIDKLQSGEKLGFDTGLDIDKILRGLQREQFYILAARPSMGKTALAIQLAQKVSTQAPVGFLSLETTNKSLGMRYLANHSDISGDKIRGGYLSDSEMSKIHDSAGSLSNLPITLDDTTDLSAEGIRAKVNNMKRKYNIGFLVVDYVQLMQGNGDTREQQVAEVSRSCVAVAKEFDICVLGLAQLSRKNINRGDKRPMLSDLRESGQLEQDAFCVMMLHRPEYYGVKTYPDGELTDGIAEIIIAKHKDGPTGVKKVMFDKPTMRFKNLSLKAHDYLSRN